MKRKNAIDRRCFLGGGTAAAGLLMGSRAFAADSTSAPSNPVVETTTGKIRGFVHEKVYGFKGIPYAASTEGAGRFMPPAKRKAWTGVLDCIELGQRSPQYGAPE